MKESSTIPRRNVKNKLMAATAMLLVATTILVATSYAWLVFSTAPEVTGITTAIASNGSLEIALLNATTKPDPSTVRTAPGSSLVVDPVNANYTWGNLVDLNDESFGLANIKLLPARLNVVERNGKYELNNSILWVPEYAYDGRIISLSDNTLTGTYKTDKFTTGETAEFGVRAIGTSDEVGAHNAALTQAKNNVKTYTNSAKTGAISALNNNASTLQTILLGYAANKNNATFNQDAVKGILNLINDIDVESVDYIDLALRQALIAEAAVEITDEAKFTLAKATISDTTTSLSEMLAKIDFDPDPMYSNAITEYNELKNDVLKVKSAAQKLFDESKSIYTWNEIQPIFASLINIDGNVFIDGKSVKEFSASDFTGSITMDLFGGSGIFSDIANFTGDYSGEVNIMGSAKVNVAGSVEVGKEHLTLIYNRIEDLKAPDGSSSSSTANKELTATYGYILDLAFRCNAPISDLLLQTDPRQRVYDDSSSPSTMGDGSYMEFPLNEDFSLEQTEKLIDAIRVAFIDDKNSVLGIAKLNTSNSVVIDDFIQAPLYLYDFSLGSDEFSNDILIMGERKKGDNVITPLTQNIAKAVSVVVWLDGDIVDNTMVSAESETSVSGMLNLQFASSADLVPAENKDLLNMTPDKTSLKATIDTATQKIEEEGQQMNSTESWNKFVEAYNYAKAVYDDSQSRESIILRANKNLIAAMNNGLEEITSETLFDKTAKLREQMGSTNEIARYIVKDGDDYLVTSSRYDVQKFETLYEIEAVDLHNNMHDEGQGIYTPIYTTESWETLADALYYAEFLQWKFTNVSDTENAAEIDKALSQLEAADMALERKIYYQPYDYEGSLYYLALTEEDDKDTYARWYNYDFKRVVNDLLIIKLDRYANAVNLFEVNIPEYVENVRDVEADPETSDSSRTEYLRLLTGSVTFNDSKYISHKGETVKYFIASNLGIATRAMTDGQRNTISNLIEELEAVVIPDDEATGEESGDEGTATASTDGESGAGTEATSQKEDLIAAANEVISEERTGRYYSTYEEASKVIFEMNAFLAESRDQALLVQMREDLMVKFNEALGYAVGFEQVDVPKLDDRGNPVVDEEGNPVFENKEAYYKALNDAINSAKAINADSTLEEVILAFDALNATLVDYNITTEKVAYPSYEFVNSAHGDKQPVYTNSFGLLVPVPNKEDDNSWKISMGGIFAVTKANGIVGYIVPHTINLYEKADGIHLTDEAGDEITFADGEEAKLVVKGGSTLTLGAELFYYEIEESGATDEPSVIDETDATDSPSETERKKMENLPVWADQPVASCTWTSSDTSVLIVNNGVVTPIREGEATISVTIVTEAGNSYDTKILVVADGFGKIGGATHVNETGTTVLTFTEGEIPHTRLSYSSTNENVLTVNSNGIVTGVNAGTADVIITVITAEGRYELRHAMTVVEIAKVTGDNSVNEDDTIELTVAGGISYTKLSYRSTDANVLTVTSNGVVTGVKAGTADVIVTVTNEYGSYELKHTVTVLEQPETN